MQRRESLKTGVSLLARTAWAPFGACAAKAQSPVSAGTARRIKKAIMWGTVGVPGSVLEKMQAIKDGGFEGVEMNSHMDQAEVLSPRDQTGLAIPSVWRNGWRGY